MKRWSILGALLIAFSHVTAYDIIREHAGPTFFDGWDFYGSWDNLTLGTSLALLVRLASFERPHNRRQCHLGNPGSSVYSESGLRE